MSERTTTRPDWLDMTRESQRRPASEKKRRRFMERLTWVMLGEHDGPAPVEIVTGDRFNGTGRLRNWRPVGQYTYGELIKYVGGTHDWLPRITPEVPLTWRAPWSSAPGATTGHRPRRSRPGP